MSQFKDGDKLRKILFADGPHLDVEGGRCDEIIVSMENGQMAGVPWFEVYQGGKLVSKWNAAAVEGVFMLEKAE